MRNSSQHSQGFTLIELVVALVVSTIVVGFVAMMLTMPVDAYLAQSRRAELNDSAETAMRRIAGDVHRALPDSMRDGVVNGSEVLDMITVTGIVTFRTDWTIGDSLWIGFDDDRFDAATAVDLSGPVNHVVVGHKISDGTDVYAATTTFGVITPSTIAIVAQPAVSPTHFRFDSNFRFTQDTTRRAYLVSTVTRYECNTANRELRRYANLPIVPALGPVVGGFDVIARDVTACTFQRRVGTPEHGGIAIVTITISRATNGNNETLRMFRELKVDNVS